MANLGGLGRRPLATTQPGTGCPAQSFPTPRPTSPGLDASGLVPPLPYLPATEPAPLTLPNPPCLWNWGLVARYLASTGSSWGNRWTVYSRSNPQQKLWLRKSLADVEGGGEMTDATAT